MRGRRSARPNNDWLMQSIASKIGTMESGNKPPVQEKERPWWQTLAMHTGANVAARAGAGKFDPKGGAGYTGIEGSMARAMKSKAKAIEDEANLKAEIHEQKKQAYNERNAQIINALVSLKKMKAQLGQEKWQRGFDERKLAQDAKIAGLRYDVKELIPEERQVVDDKHAESIAKRANIYDMIKNRNKKDPRLQSLDDVNQLFKETAKNKTRNGQLIYGNVEAAWDDFLAGNGTGALEDIQSRLQTASIDMFAEQTQELSPTGEPLGFTTARTKPAPDRDNLNRLVSGLLRSAKSFTGGVVFQEAQPTTPTTKKSKYPETKAGAKQAFDDGNYDEASKIASQLGISITDF